MTWYIQLGKYPAPKELKDMPSPVDSHIRLDVRGNVFHESQVHSLVDSLYQRAYTSLDSLRNTDLS